MKIEGKLLAVTKLDSIGGKPIDRVILEMENVKYSPIDLPTVQEMIESHACTHIKEKIYDSVGEEPKIRITIERR